jgi:glycosyltransferase involved in cell wall biosynthesis
VGPSRRDSIAGVTFTGPIDDPGALQKIYADHDVLCVTSDREGFPMVIMEAMAQGLAIMSTPVGDVPQRLDTRTALITTSVEEEVVLREMVGPAIALANDPQKLHTMRTDALDKARREFDMDAFRRRYRELLISPAAVA